MNYQAVIGLEIHAELKTHTKLFCRCLNTSSDLTTKPNSAVCPTCLGLPGALPVLNQAAVESTIKLGQSLGCRIPQITKWDRKNYFYPDLPKGYQISQYDEPLCQGGELKLPNGTAIALTRIHLEEDTGKLTHVGATSLIDYNRSSIPLLELVTEPVIESAQQAKAFAEEYQHHLRDLEVAEASMEKGQMRCEANISVVPEGTEPDKRLSGTKVEVKNLNSFKSLEKAILYEIERQSNALERGEKLVQETRGWNEAKGETYSMRVKETSDDYHYFPEPDLYPLKLSDLNVESTSSSRADLAQKLQSSDVPSSNIQTIINDPVRRKVLTDWIESGLKDYAKGVLWLIQLPKLQEYSPEEIVTALNDPNFDSSVFKEAVGFGKPGQLGGSLAEIRQKRGSHDISATITTVLTENSNEVARYKAGETQLFGFFVGQVKKALRGAGDPAVITAELKKQLN